MSVLHKIVLLPVARPAAFRKVTLVAIETPVQTPEVVVPVVVAPACVITYSDDAHEVDAAMWSMEFAAARFEIDACLYTFAQAHNPPVGLYYVPRITQPLWFYDAPDYIEPQWVTQANTIFRGIVAASFTVLYMFSFFN